MRRIVAGHQDSLETADLRHGLVIELFRQLALLDFETMYRAPAWRTYIALHATFMGLADGALRDQVQAALAESQHGRVTFRLAPARPGCPTSLTGPASPGWRDRTGNGARRETTSMGH